MMPSILQAQAHEKRVINLTIDGQIYKSLSNSGRPCYAINGIYTLENGETATTRITSERKKNMQNAIARKIHSARNGEISIDGQFEIVRWSIG
jgi:hypothetical protein